MFARIRQMKTVSRRVMHTSPSMCHMPFLRILTAIGGEQYTAVRRRVSALRSNTCQALQ
jgi:hypothetical protein